MINLQHRSAEKELLDADNIPFEHIKKNMQELDTINRVLGGHAITLKGLEHFLSPGTTEITVCEIGCGGGDNLRAIDQYCRKQNIRVSLTGIDIKAECISFARERNGDMPATWIHSDYTLADLKGDTPDVIFTSLFCHHFTNEDLVTMMRWMRANSRLGFFINDLHRNVVAYYSIKWLTKFFSSSYLVKNDAPLSVARGFRRKEWENIMQSANMRQFDVSWKWAFRHLVIANND